MANSLMLNASGYVDPTAFFAIKKEESDRMKFNDGDVVKLQLEDGRDVYRTILRMHYGYATTLFMYFTESRENEYPIIADGDIMHADLGKLGYTSWKDLENVEVVRTMSAEELAELRENIAATMGIVTETIIQSTDHKDDFELENQQLKDQIETLLQQNERFKEQLNATESKEQENEHVIIENGLASDDQDKRLAAQNLMKAVTERDIYKYMCQKMLERLS